MANLSFLTARLSRRTVAMSLYALATWLAFPHPIAGSVIDLGLSISWFAPAFLVLGLDGLGHREAARAAFFASLFTHFVFFHWFYVVVVDYGNAPAMFGILAPLAPSLYVSLFMALFGWGWSWLAARSLATPFAVALLWTTLELGRGWFLGGFPWASLGYAQHLNSALLGLAPWTGIYGLTFVTVLVGAALADLLRARTAGRPPPRVVWVALGVAVAAHVAGGLSNGFEPADDVATTRVAALQGNIDQGVKWNREWAARTIEIYEDLSRRAAADGAKIIVWPETAIPGALELDTSIQARITRLARETQAILVIGGVGVTVDASGTRVTEYYDSAFTVEPRAGIVDRYDKTHLVPFGEYVPLRGLLGWLLGAVASGIAQGDVSQGPGPRAVEIPASVEPPFPLTRIGIPICYELIFPDLVRRIASDGAAVLLAITNDAWYGRTGAPYQFLAMTALRSAETRLWTVRAANTGVSAIIDGRGRVLKSTEIFERGSVIGDVPIVPVEERGRTFYARWGNLFAYACVVALAGLAWMGRAATAETGAPLGTRSEGSE